MFNEQKELLEINFLIWTANLIGFFANLLPVLQVCSLSLSIIISIITAYKLINKKNEKEI